MGQLVSGKRHKSGYESHPAHLLRVLPAGRRVHVRCNGATLADSSEGWRFSRAAMRRSSICRARM